MQHIVIILLPAITSSLLVLSSAAMPPLDDAEVLLEELHCAACHDATGLRVRRYDAPKLEDIGARCAPGYLSQFLADPEGTKPGTTMPDLLAGYGPAEKDQLIGDLTQYLASRGGGFHPDPFTAWGEELREGKQIFESVGCRACHDAGIAHRLATKTHVDALSSFLLDPQHFRPSGRMPSMGLSTVEARVVSLYLLRDQADRDGAATGFLPGLKYEYFEENFADTGEGFLTALPHREGGVKTVGLSMPHRGDYFGVRLVGELDVPKSGSYEFFLISDDGSLLIIDGKDTVINDGVHPPRERNGFVELQKGWHAIEVRYFEHGGGEHLVLQWKEPGGSRTDIPPGSFRVQRTLYQPPENNVVPDPVRIERGRKHFLRLGCAACHEPDAPSPVWRPMRELADREGGCLAEDVPSNVPDYHLTQSQRMHLRSLLSSLGDLQDQRTSTKEVQHAMRRLDCYACHSRNGDGGPKGTRRELFTSATELGDEGRIPPDLSEAGTKLRVDWLEEVLLRGGEVRPYMHTRMPQYGDTHVGHLPRQFVRADGGGTGLDSDRGVPPDDVTVGKSLVGLAGFSCIACHEMAGYPSVGVPGTDLARTTSRLRRQWFIELLLNPMSKNPDTRMPSYWNEDSLVFEQHFDGRALPQIEAIWTYLSLGVHAPLPPGLVVDRAAYDLVPVNEVIVLGTFMKGLSARVMAVGYPERLNIAFDVGHTRMAKVWRGEFMNARGTWEGRAGQLQEPGSEDGIDLPPGIAAAVLTAPDTPWPDATGTMLGYHRVDERRPSFRYAIAGFEVEEQPVPVLRSGGPALRRVFRVTSTGGRGLVYIRLGVADQITPLPDGAYALDGHVKVRGSLPPPGIFVRQSANRQELLAALDIPAGGSAELEVMVSW